VSRRPSASAATSAAHARRFRAYDSRSRKAVAMLRAAMPLQTKPWTESRASGCDAGVERSLVISLCDPQVPEVIGQCIRLPSTSGRPANFPRDAFEADVVALPTFRHAGVVAHAHWWRARRSRPATRRCATRTPSDRVAGRTALAHAYCVPGKTTPTSHSAGIASSTSRAATRRAWP